MHAALHRILPLDLLGAKVQTTADLKQGPDHKTSIAEDVSLEYTTQLFCSTNMIRTMIEPDIELQSYVPICLTEDRGPTS